MDAQVIPMVITGVRVEVPSNTPIVLLREQSGDRFLPIWVGPVEAMAISSAMEGSQPPRPQTHDLLATTIGALGAKLVKATVTELRDSVFYAELVFEVEGRSVTVSSRPSDAIALCVRTGTPVFADPAVLDEAGIEIHDDADEAEIEEFREFLEDITVEDFLDEGGPSDS